MEVSELELEEKLITLDRVTKVVKGGKRLRFRALVAVGDGRGHVGIGLAKATGVPEAIRKANAAGRKELIEVPVVNTTIPHEILAKFGTSKVLLKPAISGTGIVASNTIRAVLELAGIKDIISKSLGSRNQVSVVKATMVALSNLRRTEEVTAEGKLDFEVQEEDANETE
ncbi:MAG: 30S ribosomal protein S5 [Dehalococcoidia bacterium]|nr:30S ribosomal protein S5 [Dehalococcoidia bacterium]